MEKGRKKEIMFGEGRGMRNGEMEGEGVGKGGKVVREEEGKMNGGGGKMKEWKKGEGIGGKRV